MEQSLNKFSYQPLEGRSEIRILRLLPGKFDEEIQCLLKHMDLDEPLEYIALSYVWGNPKVTKPIRLGYDSTTIIERGQTSKIPSLFQVTTNLEAALRHIRRLDHERILWIDAICIDQNSDKERNAQVQKMGRIYSTASEVFVWLGRLFEDSDAAKGILPDHMQAIWTLLRETTGQRPAEIGPAEDGQRDANEIVTVSKDDHLRALEAICDRSWFTRIWVLQEHALASATVSIMAGLEKIPFDSFLELVCHIYAPLTEYRPRSSFSFLTAIRHRIYRQSFRSPEFLNKPLGERILQALITTSGSFHATDPRDLLYGLLGIIGDVSTDSALAPDYKKSLEHFYLDLARFIIEDTQTLALLQCVGGKCRPSWVPNWEWHSTAAFKRFDGMRDYARCNFSDTKEVLYTSAIRLGTVILFRLIPGNISDNRAGWCESMNKLEQSLGSTPSVCNRYLNARGIRASLLDAILPEPVERASPEKNDNKERYEILMGRSIWPGALLSAGRDREHDLNHFINVIENYYIQGIGIFVLSNGMIGLLLGEPENDGAFEGDRAYVFPGCRTPLLLTPGENAYSVHWRCNVGGYLDQNEKEHLDVLRRGPLEDITII